MKANQKFRKDDEAVSPVIAVILMVAITVVLAATVYVWVSGFGSQSGTPAKSMSLSSNGPLSNGWKNFTIASATSGMKYGDVKVTVNGAEYAMETAPDYCATLVADLGATEYGACAGSAATSEKASTDIIAAGDVLHLRGVSSGQTLRILDASANSVVLTLTIG